ncbi:GntR family transcriptional regulator [Glutamicibacter sp. AOP38-B1-38]|uniref:GntR family transcriptional regulator n=1 Tax=Glutamicibacter sp. AOP38-B1-38 TaxID=3457680 RepID=UPI0040347EA0
MASSLSERLTLELRERIATGLLAPGTTVIEPALAEEFQVSKTPVRESLRQLTSEGLLQLLPKKGYLVRAISMEDIHEVLELRILLEPRAARNVARFHSAQTLAELRGHLAEQEHLAEADPIASMLAARRFHEDLSAANRNSRITATLTKCFAETARAHYVLPAMQPYMSQSAELAEHRAILAAIGAADAQAAENAMRTHLQSIHRAMLGQLQNPDSLWG